MLDMIYNCRQGELPTAKASEEWIELSTRLESTLNEEQIELLHKLLDCVSETAATEMRTAYKAGFKDAISLMNDIRNIQ